MACSNNKPKEDISSKTPESSEEQYNIVRPDFTPDYDNYQITASPFGANMSYYSDI